MGRAYRFLEHSGDAFLEASGSSLGEALAGAARPSRAEGLTPI